jgi:citrate lyase subunit beta/citryl-CoA lyase
VLASRVAGLAPPVDSVYTKIDDLEGLEREARGGRNLGMFGKGAIHPRQIEIINRVFTPSEKEVAQAREVIDAARDAAARGSGAIKLPNGDFVDKPIVERAEALLVLAERLA